MNWFKEKVSLRERQVSVLKRGRPYVKHGITVDVWTARIIGDYALTDFKVLR